MKGRLPVSDQVLEASRKEVSVGLGARKERPPSFLPEAWVPSGGRRRKCVRKKGNIQVVWTFVH